MESFNNYDETFEINRFSGKGMHPRASNFHFENFYTLLLLFASFFYLIDTKFLYRIIC